jgi:hypothetical protein
VSIQDSILRDAVRASGRGRRAIGAASIDVSAGPVAKVSC